MSLGGTVLTILLPTQMHFSKVTSKHLTVQSRGMFQLTQQAVIIRTASQGVFTKSSSYLIVIVEFTPFWGYLQLDHPVTCENIKCYTHIQIITWIKSYNFFDNLLPLTIYLPCVTKTEFLLTISITHTHLKMYFTILKCTQHFRSLSSWMNQPDLKYISS